MIQLVCNKCGTVPHWMNVGNVISQCVFRFFVVLLRDGGLIKIQRACLPQKGLQNRSVWNCIPVFAMLAPAPLCLAHIANSLVEPQWHLIYMYSNPCDSCLCTRVYLVCFTFSGAQQGSALACCSQLVIGSVWTHNPMKTMCCPEPSNLCLMDILGDTHILIRSTFG